MKKITVSEAQRLLESNGKINLKVIGRDHYNNSKHETFKIINTVTESMFYIQPSRLLTTDYKIIQYNTESFRKTVDRITNGEYQLVGESSKYNSMVSILHTKCNTISKYRASHFVNDSTRCKKCNIKRITTTNEQIDIVLKTTYNSVFSRVSDYVGYHKDIILKCNTCKKEITTKMVNLKRQYDTFKNVYCPFCSKISHGEAEIYEYLTNLNIKFSYQYSTPKCKYKNVLKFDFAIFNDADNLLGLIEYDGKQHFDVSSKYAKDGRFENIKIRDNIKDNFCKNENIPILRIRTTGKLKIKKEIDEFLKKLCYYKQFNDYPSGGEIPHQE